MDEIDKKRIFIPPDEISDDISDVQKNNLIDKIKSIVKRHSLCDKDWTQAISSQNFLVDLAFILDMRRDSSFTQLLNVFLESFSPCFDGGFKLNEKNILIIPDENKKLIDCMKHEDEIDTYFHGTLAANIITNPDIIYKNYLYGTMINIATAAINNPQLTNVFNYCMKELLSNEALDINRGGWVHYRLPWITARILLGFHNIMKNDSLVLGELYDQICQQEKLGVDSLLDRIYDKKFWRSGAGDWVSVWESTGLCLEAIITAKDWMQNSKYVESIDGVIDYLFSDEVFSEWFPKKIDFSCENYTNDILAQIVLCSVTYRILKLPQWKRYAHYCSLIGQKFIECINAIDTSSVINARQFCTIPQILLYIAKAIKA